MLGSSTKDENIPVVTIAGKGQKPKPPDVELLPYKAAQNDPLCAQMIW